MKKVIPVVVIKELSETQNILARLVEGGLNIAEITFRTSCAKDAIALGRKLFPEMEIGAGTVINAEQCEEAISVGAKFIVSPGLSENIAIICKERGLPYYPGCVTPTEIMKALSLGIEIVKFFPANVYGGIAALKALSAPFPQLKFIPTGGVDLKNLKEYLELPMVYAVGGSFMMKGDVVKNSENTLEVIKSCKL